MKRSILFLCIFFALSAVTTAYAYSVKDILDGNQDYLILGTIKDVDSRNVTVTVDNTVGKEAPDLKIGDISIEKFSYSYCEEHTSTDFNNPKIGDNIFASVNLENGKYKISGGAYKVDSSEIKNCSVIVYQDMKGEDCLNDAVKISYFIRTNGKITEFETDGSGSIYAVSDDDKILIYPLPGNESIKFVDAAGKVISEDVTDDVMPIVPNNLPKDNAGDNRWITAVGIIASGALFGFVMFYVLYMKKRL